MNHQLSRELSARAASLQLPDTPVERIVATANRRRVRRRAGLAAAGLLATAGLGVVAVDNLTHETELITTGTSDDPSIDAAPTHEPDSTSTEPAAVAPLPDPAAGSEVERMTAVESSLVWRRVDVDSAEAIGMTFTTTDLNGPGPYFAVSTAPGPMSTNEEFHPQLWQSDDGMTWRENAAAPSMSLRGLATGDGVVYAVGTSAATAPISNGAGDLVLARSTDKGSTWGTEVLPLDLRGLADEPGIGGLGVTASIAVGPAGTIAVVVPQSWLSLDELPLAADIEIDERWGYQLDDSGMTAMLGPDPIPCTSRDAVTASTVAAPATVPADSSAATPSGVSTTTGEISAPPTNMVPAELATCYPETAASRPGEHYTWAQLGVSERAAAAMLGTPIIFRSVDGGPFEQVAILPPAIQREVSPLRADDAGYVLAVGRRWRADGTFDPAALLRSMDGISWTTAFEVPDGVDSVLLADEMAGQQVVVGQAWWNGGSAQVLVGSDGAGWTTTDLNGLITEADGPGGSIQPLAATVGSEGLTISAILSFDPIAVAGGVEVEANGYILEIPTGNFETWYLVAADTGEVIRRQSEGGFLWGNSLEVFDESGALIASFPQTDIDAAQVRANEQGKNVESKFLVLHSVDGVQWSREDIAGLAGVRPLFVHRLQSVDGKVTLSATYGPSTPADPADQFVLIGTPKG